MEIRFFPLRFIESREISQRCNDAGDTLGRDERRLRRFIESSERLGYAGVTLGG
jgi:hypothetical protein